MTIVKSPYNFVPAPNEDQVFKPMWADQVSHDVPFEDGESGEIEIEITAETPIFIRNGYAKPNEGEKPTEEFSHYTDSNGKKQYFIPATSMKGMVRNVLEIMSFSRLNKDLMNDHRYAFRDLSSANNQYMLRYKKYQIKGGWLTENKDRSWEIEKCEFITHIDHKELLENLGIPFREEFLNKQPKQKDAKYKYEHPKVRLAGLTHPFSTFKNKLFGDVEINMAKYESTGKKGTLVFTGQPGPRFEPTGKKASGKIREFVFFNSENPTRIKVSEDQQKDFKFIYGHDDPNNLSPDWGYWREKLRIGQKIPVFFAEDNDGNLQHFGLSYMYKLPYEHRISQLKPLSSYGKEKDLAETIFGFTEKNVAQKGRVMFGHAIADQSTVKELKPVSAILGGPKASYFPYYLSQFQKPGNYYTYDNLDATLRGFKRYPVKERAEENPELGENSKVISYFKPLGKGAKFSVKVRFHNLKAEEIGALLSAITFHGYADQFFHNIGAAKALGYGKVNAKVKDLKFLKKSAEDYMLDFENLMNSNYPEWLASPQVKELFAMAKGGVNEDFLQYPSVQEYADYKKKKVNRIEKDLDKLESFTETFGLQDFSKTVRPFSIRLKPQNSLDLNFKNYQDLSKYLNEEISVFGEFTDSNKKLIFDKLTEIIESKHKDSIKKMKKSAHWSGNITKWLGENLKTTLQNKYGLGLED